MAFSKTYQTEETQEEQSLKFFFVSTGERDIIKAVEYRYVQPFGEQPLFNLGFGDYDIETNVTSDIAVSNNGDHFPVFHTVLGTIPRFFEVNPNAIIMVIGSDHGTDFVDNCKQTCKKKCVEHCRNIDRRINAYRWYVNKNFEELNKTYIFYGGLRQEDGTILTELYDTSKQYDSVFCKKIITLPHEI